MECTVTFLSVCINLVCIRPEEQQREGRLPRFVPLPCSSLRTLTHPPWNSPALLDGMGNRSTCAGQGRLTLGQFVSNLETLPPSPPPPHPLHMLTSIRHGADCRAVALLSRDDVGHRTKKLDIFRETWTAVVLKLWWRNTNGSDSVV